MLGTNPRPPLIFLAAVALAGGLATSFPEPWTLDLERAMQGEWWRFATGHLVHLTWQHYRLDLIALTMAVVLCRMNGERFGAVLSVSLLSAASVSLMLALVQPVQVYGGLSGITAGLVVCAAMGMIGRVAWLPGGSILMLLAIKIVSEWCGISASAVPPVWQAHCAGALAGMGHGVMCGKGHISVSELSRFRPESPGRNRSIPWSGSMSGSSSPRRG